jgi:hypothetical protein
MGMHQTKELYTEKETATRLKRESKDWEKIFAATHLISTNIQNLQETQKIQPPMTQHPCEEIGT